MFGAQPLEFTRVVDEAGILTHHERRELMEALEDMERNIPPVALGIFITSHGQVKQFRPHAHWALNHAVIHHPSFGKRESVQAIEDADLSMGRRGGHDDEQRAEPGAFVTWCKQLRKRIRDFVHPYPPPVRQEWMLILVLDVQLEVACFTWGYMLDPYINPDSINSSISRARLYFRERATAVGLRKVMKAAVGQIAARSYSVNKRMRRSPMLPIALVGLGVLASSLSTAQPPTTSDQQPSESPPEQVGRAATPQTSPRWSSEDYRRLLAGEISAGYKMLADSSASPPPPAKEEGNKEANARRISKRFYQGYLDARGESLLDPQSLLDAPARADVDYILRSVNANSGYHLYVAIFRSGQDIPMELSAGTLARSVAQPGEYAVMLMFGMGDTPQVELGYHEMDLKDEDRHAWLDQVRREALIRGGGVEGIIAAVQQLHTCLIPVAEQLPPLEQRSDLQVPLIPIQMHEDEEAEEVTVSDELQQVLNNPTMRPLAAALVGALGLTALVLGFIWFRHRSGHLLKSRPDVRLSSPYGAGVSRNVNYLEGREEKKPTDLF